MRKLKFASLLAAVGLLAAGGLGLAANNNLSNPWPYGPFIIDETTLPAVVCVAHPGEFCSDNAAATVGTWDGTTWIPSVPASVNYLTKTNNLSDVANPATARTNLLAAPLASPAFTGTPTSTNPGGGDSSTRIATTNFVQQNYANLVSPTFTGVPAAPTAATATNTTQLATTAFVTSSPSITTPTLSAPIFTGALTGASGAFSGIVTGPTAAVDTNTTQYATTGFVVAQAGAANPVMDGAAAPGVSLRYARQDHVHPTDTTRAAAGANSDITALSALSTPITLAQGGTGGTAGGYLLPGGRITLTTGVPVLTSAVTASTTIYYTPYNSNVVPIWNGTTFVPTAFAETSQLLSDATKSPLAAAASNVYDIFCWSDTGTVRCTRGPSWNVGGGSAFARGSGAGSSAIARTNGVLTNVNAVTNGPAAGFGTYVGTIYTDTGGGTVTFDPGSSAAGGGQAWIGLWNRYNSVPVTTAVRNSTGSWTYGAAAFRAANGSVTFRVTMVMGDLDNSFISAHYSSVMTTGAAAGSSQIGVGLDSVTTVAASSSVASISVSQAGQDGTAFGEFSTGIGAHVIQALEAAQTVATTFFGSTLSMLSTRSQY